MCLYFLGPRSLAVSSVCVINVLNLLFPFHSFFCCLLSSFLPCSFFNFIAPSLFFLVSFPLFQFFLSVIFSLLSLFFSSFFLSYFFFVTAFFSLRHYRFPFPFFATTSIQSDTKPVNSPLSCSSNKGSIDLGDRISGEINAILNRIILPGNEKCSTCFSLH